jgi:hypothetical protein
MKRHRLVISSIVTVVAFGSIALAGAFNTDTTGVVRVEKVSSRDWHFGCHLDACLAGPLAIPAFSVSTPVAEPTVDVVVTATVEFQTTPGDFAVLEMRYDDGPGAPIPMGPRGWVLDSSGRFTSTTVTWIARNVPAAGTDYEFSLLALPRKSSPDGHFHIRGRRTVAVVELWSAG